MTALMADSPRNIEQRFFVKLLDHAFMQTRGIYDLMQQHIASSGCSRVEIQRAMIRLNNQRIQLLSATDSPYVQRLNACAQELKQDIDYVSGVFRVKFCENPTPVAMRRLKHYLIDDLTALADKLQIAGKRAKIDFSQSIAAASRMMALMRTIPDRVEEVTAQHGGNVISLNPNLAPITSQKARKPRSTKAPVIATSIVRSAVPPLDQYGDENYSLAMSAEPVSVEIAIFLRAQEHPRDTRKQRRNKPIGASTQSTQDAKASNKETARRHIKPDGGTPNDDAQPGERDGC